METTFYGQFAAGENLEIVKNRVEMLKSAGIRPMLCIPIESKKEEIEIDE